MQIPPSLRVLTCRFYRSFDWNYPSLSAPYWRIYYNTTSSAELVFEGRALPLTPDKLYIIAPDTPYSAHTDGGVDHFFIHFTLSADIAPVVPLITDIRLSQVHRLMIEDLIDDLDRVGDNTSYLKIAALCYSVLADLPPQYRVSVIKDRAVLLAVSFINTHLNRTLHEREIAASAMVSARTLRRRFLAGLGITPAAYVQKRRIEQACIHLHFSPRSIDEIAAATGFCDRFHFSRVFSRLRGMGPAAYRRIVDELNPEPKNKPEKNDP